MKILQVFDFFSLPHGGGTADIIAKLSKALVDRGHEVTICTGDYEFDWEFIDSVPLFRANISVFHSRLNRFGIYWMPELKSFDISKFDAVHFHCYRSYQNSVLYRKAIKAGVPYIVDAHGSTVDKGAKNVLRKVYDLAWGYDSLKHASRVIAETEIGVAEWQKLGVPDSKITLLHPFIDIHEFENLPKRGEFRDKHHIADHIVLFMGRINKEKGLSFLVKAFGKLNDVRPDVTLVIVGQDDGYQSKLEDQIIFGEALSNKVVFTGFLSGRDKLSALVDADMLIQPSRNEAGARPSLEALMCNIPVIVTENTGAGLEIRGMNGGFTVQYGNCDELAIYMRQILDDPTSAQIKVQCGKEYIKANLSLESQIVRYEALYNEVMA